MKCGEVYGGLRATSFLFFIYLFFNKGRFHGFCRFVSFIQEEEKSLSSVVVFFFVSSDFPFVEMLLAWYLRQDYVS